MDFKPVTLKDKVHCVAYVLDAAKVSLLPSKVEEKLTAIRQRVNSLGIITFNTYAAYKTWKINI